MSETLRTTMEFFLDDCSMEVISERQGINVATVKSRLHAARKLVVECGRKGVPNHV
ncbi:sigma factor-like helix-turn-helix DNA-binding protein [Bradyrhizobium neotropicale]|uniref:sigma factor-like helix-turn-helix DNA-binding protein n=1 Tax=Bradyrhizobium neotropicale TaxID=1497615 RepID=UPI0039080ECD